eukprot:11203187-Lingulodinium_polyedra.AAC.1
MLDSYGKAGSGHAARVFGCMRRKRYCARALGGSRAQSAFLRRVEERRSSPEPRSAFDESRVGGAVVVKGARACSAT